MLKAALRHKESVYARMKKQDILRFSLDKEWYGINAKDVTEVIRCPKIFSIPHTPNHIMGMIDLRGEILTVIDIRKLLGLPTNESSHRRYVVVVEQQGVKVGIIADRVSDLVSVPGLAAGPSLSDIDNTASLIAGEVHFGEVVLAILNLDKLIASGGQETSARTDSADRSGEIPVAHNSWSNSI